jgi:hypothetical protein
MAIKLGEIFVSLGLSTASFTKGLNDAKQLAFGSSREIERSFQVLGTALVGVASGLALLTKQSIDNADHMGKLARSTGTSVEQFSALAFAAKRSDVDTAILAKGLVILAKNLEKANQQTLEGKAAHSALSTLFRANIPVFKDTGDAFQHIAAKLSELPDGLQKTALAAQILGKNGAALIPMLGTLEEMTARAAKLGVVISGPTAAAAEKFNETFKDIKASGDAFVLQLAAELLPLLQRLANQFREGAQQAQGYSANLQVAKALVQLVATAVLSFTGALRDLANVVVVVGTVIAVMSDKSLSWKDRVAGVKESLRQLGDGLKSTSDTIKTIWVPAMAAVGLSQAQAFEAGHRWLARYIAETSLAGGANEDARKKLEQFVQSLRDEIFAHTHNVIAINEYKAAQLGANAADLDAIGVLSRKIFFLDLAKKGLESPKVPAVPITMANLPSMAGARDKNALAELEKTLQPINQAWFEMQKNIEGVSGAIQKIPLTPLQLQMKELAQGMREFNTHALRAFGDWLIMGGAVRQMLAGILEDLARMVFEILVVNTLKSAFSNWFGGFAEGGVIPGRASGGPTFGGPFLVGERGPELFMPPASGGMIVPNNRLPAFAGAGGSVTYNIDARGADPTVEFRIRRALQETENRAVARAVVMSRESQLRTA